MNSSPVLAIVVPVFNEEALLPGVQRTLHALLKRLIDNGEIDGSSYLLFVDDGSNDCSWEILSRFHRQDPEHIRALRLSRNFGHNLALMAGLEHVNGHCDAVVTIDGDLQQDPEAIPLFLEKFRQGNEVVFGIRRDRNTDDACKRWTAVGFYRLMRFLGVRLHENHADYRLLGRRALAALCTYPEPDPFLRALCVDLGFRNAIVHFDVRERQAGSSKYSFGKMLRFAIHGVTSFSARPLRFVSLIGVIVFGFSLLMTAYVLVTTLLIGGTVPGWASTILPIYLIGGLQILCIGIVGEYLARVYSAVKARPRYIVEEKLLALPDKAEARKKG